MLAYSPAMAATEVAESVDEISPERLELARKVFSEKCRGTTQEGIAESLSISRSTVCRLLVEYRLIYAKSLAETPTLHLVSQELARLEENESHLREKAATTVSERLHLGYLRLAHDVTKTRLNLLLETGVIPKEPTKLLTLTGHLDSGRGEDDPRTDDEIMSDIMKLLAKGRRLT